MRVSLVASTLSGAGVDREMPYRERPLSPSEHEDLRRIRRNRQIRRERAEISNAGYWSGWGKLLLFLVIWFAATWPCYVWHGQPSGAHGENELPTATGWIVESIWLGVVVLPLTVLFFYLRREEKRGNTKDGQDHPGR
jgi:hypothetical protein